MRSSAARLASLRSRICAFLFDYIPISVYLGTLAILVRVLRMPPAWFASRFLGELEGFFLVTLPVALYFIISESSNRQGTWGKRRMHLRVGTVNDQRIGWVRATWRAALKFLPWELAHAAIWEFRFGGGGTGPANVLLASAWGLVGANLAFFLVARRRQAIYDWLSGSRVFVD